MTCPKCGTAARCIDSRPSIEHSTRRRYNCYNKKCALRWSTLERAIGFNQRGKKAVETFTAVYRKHALTSLRDEVEKMIAACDVKTLVAPSSKKTE